MSRVRKRNQSNEKDLEANRKLKYKLLMQDLGERDQHN